MEISFKRQGRLVLINPTAEICSHCESDDLQVWPMQSHSYDSVYMKCVCIYNLH